MATSRFQSHGSANSHGRHRLYYHHSSSRYYGLCRDRRHYVRTHGAKGRTSRRSCTLWTHPLQCTTDTFHGTLYLSNGYGPSSLLSSPDSPDLLLPFPMSQTSVRVVDVPTRGSGRVSERPV